MNSDISLPNGNVVTLPVKELTPKEQLVFDSVTYMQEQLQADMLHLKGRPALVSYRDNGSVIGRRRTSTSKKERSRAKRLVKKAQRA
jgi:hypothetical protein